MLGVQLAFNADFPYLSTLLGRAFVEGVVMERSEAVGTSAIDFPVTLVGTVSHELIGPTRVARVITDHHMMLTIPFLAPFTIVLRMVC